LIGPPPSKDDVGLVGNFNPKALDRAAIEKKAGKVFSKEEWEKLESHAASRRNEYAEMKHDLETKAKFAEKVAVDEARGVLVDARNGATKGKEFTGDHDLFSIEKPVGNGKYEVVTSESDPKLYKAVTDDLKADPHVQAQHGAHTSWEADKGAPLTPKEQKISDKIYDQHKADAKPSEALTTFDADGTVHETHYDGPKGSTRTGGQ
jgi:hypothetical protein